MLKGLFTKRENSVIDYSPSCRSKLSFIFGTQVKLSVPPLTATQLTA